MIPPVKHTILLLKLANAWCIMRQFFKPTYHLNNNLLCVMLNICLLTSTTVQAYALMDFEKKRFLGQTYYRVTLTSNDYKPCIVAFDPPTSTRKGIAQSLAIPNRRNHTNIYAVNASYFDADGKPIGLIKQNGKWRQSKATSKPRAAVGWSRFGPATAWFFDVVWHDHNGAIASLLRQTPWWDGAQNILQGAGLLLYRGQKLHYHQERLAADFINRRYARTMLCVQKDHTAKLIVVKGTTRTLYRLGLFRSSGVNLKELQMLALFENCYYAINLDGGYSSQLISQHQAIQGVVLNILPYRSVSNALYFVKSFTS
jgi:hypothetical protein